jgi:hypothetical protein
MFTTHTHDVQHATASYEHKKALQKHREAFLQDVATGQEALSDTINEMAEKHDKYIF